MQEQDIFNTEPPKKEIFVDYTTIDNNNSPYNKKKKVITIVVVTIVALMLIAGAFVAGLLSGQNSGVNSDMPLLVEAYQLLKKYYYEDIDWSEFEEIAAKAVMGSVDNFTGMYDVDTSSSSYAAGFTISINKYHKQTISFVTPNSPAANATPKKTYTLSDSLDLQEDVGITATGNEKIEIGDRIYAVSVNNGLVFSVVDGTDLSYTSSIINSSLNGIITMYFLKSNGDDTYGTTIQSFEIEMGIIPNTEAFYYDSTSITTLPTNTAMIKLNSFTGTAVEDFSSCINQFVTAGKTNLILDLRNNGGGDANILGYIAGCLVEGAANKEVNIAYYKYNSGDYNYSSTYFTSLLKSSSNGNVIRTVNLPSVIPNFKMTILCNGGSASCSEVLIGALEYYNNVEIIGSTTYGKGVAQTVRTIGGGKYYLYITNGKYYIPTMGADGKTEWTTCIHGVGFTPEDANKINKDSCRPYNSDLYIAKALTKFE